MFEKIRDNKLLKIIWNIIYTILVIIVIMILLVVAMQRFSNNNISLGGFRIFNVVTSSMIPDYKVGDVILVREVPISELKAGDDITYIGKDKDLNGKTITHKIEKIEKLEDGTYKIITKGIANVLQDPEITDKQVKGKVVYKFKILSFLSNIVNKSIEVMFICIFLPIALILFINIRKVSLDIKNAKEDKEDKE